MNETMNLHEYYRNHKDAINASKLPKSEFE